METPLITVIIPIKTISHYLLTETFPALNKQTDDRFEVIVVSDRKEAKELQLTENYPWLHFIHSDKGVLPPEKRNLAVKIAQGNLLAFIDDDAYPEKNWLKKARQIFHDKRIAALGGPGLLPPQVNDWERVFDTILLTWIGSGNFTYRFKKQPCRYIDDYPTMNFFIRKNVFTKVGGFDKRFWTGEDSKLCEDVVYHEKEKILYHPEVIVYHHRRHDLLSYLKQHQRYGFHRGLFFARGDKNSRYFSYLLPSLFVIYLFFLLCLILFSIFFKSFRLGFYLYIAVPLILYFFGMVYLLIITLSQTKKLKLALASPAVLFSTHLMYGIMFMKGLFIGLIKKKIHL